MPESCRKRITPVVSSGVVLFALLSGAGGLSLLARTEHPGRFLLAAVRGGRFVEVGSGVLQASANDCGPAALIHCLRELGEDAPYPDPECRIPLTERGCRMDALAAEAARRGWTTRSRRLERDRIGQVRVPAILHSREGHFLVYEGVRADGRLLLHDPAVGRITHTPWSLARRWTGHVLEFVAPARDGHPAFRGPRPNLQWPGPRRVGTDGHGA